MATARDQKAQDRAQKLEADGKVVSATVDQQTGKVMVRNQISGNDEEYHGQPMQNPAGNYLGRKGKP